MPEWTIYTWSINDKIYSYVWIIWDNISRNVNISKTPIDPSSKTNYIYAVNNSQNEYQIASTLENSLAHNNHTIEIIETAYATSELQARVLWNYTWYIKFFSWSSNEFFYQKNVI